MPVFHKTHEPQTSEQYVSELERQLRRGLPPEKTEEITREVRAHLADRVEDLTDSGLARHEAEACAVSGFGTARHYAHEATLTAYGDRASAGWRLAGRLAMANALGLIVCIFLLMRIPITAVFVLLALSPVVLLAAFKARLPQTRTYLALVGLATVAVGVGAGIRVVPVKDTPPVLLANGFTGRYVNGGNMGPGMLAEEATQAIVWHCKVASYHATERLLLNAGMDSYALGRPVPPFLRSNGRYIVPAPLTYDGSHLPEGTNRSAFKDLDVSLLDDAQVSSSPWARRAAPHTVATKSDAKRVWAERGALWQARKTQAVGENLESARFLQMYLQSGPHFNTGAMTSFASIVLQWGLALVALDAALAYLGRLNGMTKRNRRRQTVA